MAVGSQDSRLPQQRRQALASYLTNQAKGRKKSRAFLAKTGAISKGGIGRSQAGGAGRRFGAGKRSQSNQYVHGGIAARLRQALGIMNDRSPGGVPLPGAPLLPFLYGGPGQGQGGVPAPFQMFSGFDEGGVPDYASEYQPDIVGYQQEPPVSGPAGGSFEEAMAYAQSLPSSQPSADQPGLTAGQASMLGLSPGVTLADIIPGYTPQPILGGRGSFKTFGI